MLDIEIVTSCLISDQYHSSTWIMLTEFVGNWRLWYCCLTDIHISTCILPSTVVGTTTCIKKLDCNSPTDWVTCRFTQCTPLGAAPWWSLTPLTRLLLVTDRACVRARVRPSVGTQCWAVWTVVTWTWVGAKNHVLCGGLGRLVVAGSVAEWLACWTHVQ